VRGKPPKLAIVASRRKLLTATREIQVIERFRSEKPFVLASVHVDQVEKHLSSIVRADHPSRALVQSPKEN